MDRLWDPCQRVDLPCFLFVVCALCEYVSSVGGTDTMNLYRYKLCFSQYSGTQIIILRLSPAVSIILQAKPRHNSHPGQHGRVCPACSEP